jgi:hypothetical protein
MDFALDGVGCLPAYRGKKVTVLEMALDFLIELE